MRHSFKGEHSYKHDETVPAFDDAHPLVIFDGVCHFCSRSMRIVFEHERTPINFAPTQSSLGRALLTHYGLDANDPASFLYLDNGHALQSSTAVFALAKQIKGWPTLIRLFWVIPRPLTNFAYKLFARNRYKWFGKSNTCLIPSPEMKSRLISSPEVKE